MRVLFRENDDDDEIGKEGDTDVVIHLTSKDPQVYFVIVWRTLALKLLSADYNTLQAI